jgi:hypothetical protein
MPTGKPETGTAAYAWTQASACAELALNASTPRRREMFLRLRDSWILIANELQFVEAVKDVRRTRMKPLRAYFANNPH